MANQIQDRLDLITKVVKRLDYLSGEIWTDDETAALTWGLSQLCNDISALEGLLSDWTRGVCQRGATVDTGDTGGLTHPKTGLL